MGVVIGLGGRAGGLNQPVYARMGSDFAKADDQAH